LHLAGISSMLGAMNSKKTFLFKQIRKYYISNIRLFYSNNNINTNNNDPNNKNKWKFILGRKGLQKYPHRIAFDFLKKNEYPSVDIINEILSHCNIRITEKQLTKLVNLPKYIINTKNSKNINKEIKDLIGSPSSKTQVAGVYIFTHIASGSKYVGSSSQLAIRLRSYIKNKDRSIGLFIPLLRKEGISNFVLEIIPIYDNISFRGELILEQYYLLNPMFNLNTIRVVNNPSGSRAKALYIYNRDKTILYYYSTQQKDFITNLNIHYVTFNKHLKYNTYYLGKYSFSRELVLSAKDANISIHDLALKLQKDRIIFNKNKPTNSESKVILLTSLTLFKDVNKFYGIRPCINYLRKERGFPSTRETLIKHIKNGKPYHGYICKYI
jgi:GIY-YIG catalytic domain